MHKIHKQLTDKVPWYKAWHCNRHSSYLHWFVFLLAAELVFFAFNNMAISLRQEVSTGPQILVRTGSVFAADTVEWSFAGTNKPIVEQLGALWKQSSDGISCLDGNDGGPTRITLPNAPNGIYDLWLKVYRSPLYHSDPHTMFYLNGQFYDFVPPAGSTGVYEWVRVTPIQITENKVTLVIDDDQQAGIILKAFKIVQSSQQSEFPLAIQSSVLSGEIPFSVQFSAAGDNLDPSTYQWDFGDGGTSNLSAPSHTYTTLALQHVILLAKNYLGQTGIAKVDISALPSKTNLPGLTDIQSFGFYSAGLKNNAEYKPGSPTTLFNARRMDELQAFGMNYVIPGTYWHSWYSDLRYRQNYYQFLQDLLAKGIKTGANAGLENNEEDSVWYTGDELALPHDQWVFDPTEAISLLKASDENSDGISDLDGQISHFYLGHEIAEFATHQERKQMYEIVKPYFPNTPIMSYPTALVVPFERAGTPAPAGGLWDEYQFGPGETDILLISAGFPFSYDVNGNRLFDLKPMMDRIMEQKLRADAIAPNVPIWVSIYVAGEEANASVNDMWKPEELLDAARSVLSVGDIQGLFFRAYGRWTYDLAYGVNTANPTQPETGFIEQRAAVKEIGQWIKDAQTNQPPTVSASANPTSGTAPLTVNFTATASDPDGTIAKYAWDFGDGGTASVSNPTHTYSVAGTYTANVTVSDNAGATASAQIVITVKANQPPTVSASANPMSGNAPLTVNFTATAQDSDGTIASYLWNFGDSSITNTQNPTHIYNAAGTYTATVEVTDNGGATAQASVPIVVNPPLDTTPPTASITAPLNGATVAVKSTVTITATATDNVGVAQVQFFINGALLSTDATSPYSAKWKVPAAKGRTYQIQATATDKAGNVGKSAIIKVTAR